ncbi:hypothetical protein F4805DRAFT_456219 [Annulohypoxylon moriforme]|nr:hypothetical protein F4805DRAFT_456219 [Annulohypoxylon moriforme]
MDQFNPNINASDGRRFIRDLGIPNIHLSCGNWVFHVHAIVILPGLKFYERATKDAAGHHCLHLEDEDPDMLRWLLVYLYQDETNLVLQGDLDDPKTFFNTCHKILRIARAFDISRFHQILVDPLRDLIREQAATLTTYCLAVGGQDVPLNDALEDNFVEEYVRLAGVVYGTSFHTTLRPILVHFLLMTVGHTLFSDVFHRLKQAIPALDRDLTFAMAQMDAGLIAVQMEQDF